MREIPLPIVGNISSIIDGALWSIGLATGYLVMNMVDVNYHTPQEACTGKTGAIRLVISAVAFAAAVFYQFHGQLENIAGDIVGEVLQQ
jgi:hypothetical protein